MSVSDHHRKAADRLWHAQNSAKPCEPIREMLPGNGIQDAYTVQNINTERRLAAGRRIVGRKIGLTAKAVQKQLGVEQPDYGMLFDDMAYVDGDEIPLQTVLQPKIEAEIAVVLDKDLRHERLTAADVLSAVGYAVPALEIVGSRIANWDINITDTIADNASSGLFVLGTSKRSLSAFDLRLCGMVMERRGDQVSVGCGQACLGNPINAVLWLARTMVEVGRPLLAGDVVLSGSLGPMVPLNAGDTIQARINRLGEVRASFV